MSFLLDTNILSEIRKGRRCNPGLREWFQGIDDADIFLSVLVIGEIRLGIERLRQRDAIAAKRLENWLQHIIHGYNPRILPITAEITDFWARLNAPRPLPVINSLLAASAQAHGLTLVTRNLKDLHDCAIPMLNPFN